MVREQSSASAPASIFKEQTLLTGRGYKLLWRLASGSGPPTGLSLPTVGHPLGKNQVLWRRYNPNWAPIGSKLALVRTWQKEVNGGQSAQVIAAQWARLHVRRRTCKVVRDLKGFPRRLESGRTFLGRGSRVEGKPFATLHMPFPFLNCMIYFSVAPEVESGAFYLLGLPAPAQLPNLALWLALCYNLHMYFL